MGDNMEFTRFSETAIPKSKARVVSIMVKPTITDCTGVIWFTDLQLQEGDWQSGYAPHTRRALVKYRKDGVIQPPMHFNGIVRGGATVVLANASIEMSGDTVIIDKSPQVSAGLDCYIYSIQDMKEGAVALGTGMGSGAHRCRFLISPRAGDELALLASSRQCLRNGTATLKEGFFQYVAYGDSKHIVELEEDKSARVLFRFQQTQEGGELEGDEPSSTVQGPNSSNDGNIAVFDGTTGKKIKDSGIAMSSIRHPNLLSSGDAQITATDPYGRTDTLTQSNLDVGTFIVGRDYYVFLSVENGNPVYRISLNKNFDIDNLIGGFHYGKVRRVNDSLAPVNTAGTVRGSGWESNVYDGIVPRSVWTLKHRPTCEPEGMVYLSSGTWVDIYLSSDDGAGGLASAYNKTPLTGTEGLNWYDFNERALVSGKRLLSHSEWLQMAVGSPGGNNGDNLNAWSATTNAGKNGTGLVERAVSSVGCMDAVGNVWEWLDEFITNASGRVLSGTTNPTSFTYTDGARNGKVITNGSAHGATTRADNGAPVAGAGGWDRVSPFPDGYGNINEYYDQSLIALRVGGSWGDGVQAGARTVSTAPNPWLINTATSTRCACDSL